jgi:type II secretion system protein G
MTYNPRGFTLIELLVVIAIIGVLSSVVLASLSTARSKGNDARRISDIHAVNTALALYANDNQGTYPLGTSGSGCGGAWGCVDNLTQLVSSKYISKLPTDPTYSGTGNDYRYCGSGNSYVIIIRTQTLQPTTWCRPSVPPANPPCWGTYPPC